MCIVDGWHDIESAWEEAEKTFAADTRMRDHALYWYPRTLLYVPHGDYALAESTAKKIGPRWFYVSVMALIHAQKRECEKAQTFADSILGGTREDYNVLLLYKIGECLLESGRVDIAEKFLHESQGVYSNQYGFRAVFYPKSFYLLGKVNEAKKNKKGAVENYEKFLDIWKAADDDLPELIDAKKRLAKLSKKGSGTSA
jgi:tetratricopeptide (TPR) repeat protein